MIIASITIMQVKEGYLRGNVIPKNGIRMEYRMQTPKIGINCMHVCMNAKALIDFLFFSLLAIDPNELDTVRELES